MDLWRSRWILGVVLGSFAVVGTPAGADEPNFTEEQKTDFMRKQAKVCQQAGEKGGNPTSHLTLSDRKVTHDASFQPIDERKVHEPGIFNQRSCTVRRGTKRNFCVDD